jgi:hypothetical protein
VEERKAHAEDAPPVNWSPPHSSSSSFYSGSGLQHSERRQAETEGQRTPAGTTHLAAQTWGEHSRAKPAGKREAAGTSAAETAEDNRGCRPAAPATERVAATAEELEGQPARTAEGTTARLNPAAHPSRRGRALKQE